MTKKVVFTVKDLAKYLNVHPMTIYRYLQNNKLPAFKMGNSWRFNRESIDQWRLNEETVAGNRNPHDCSGDKFKRGK